MIKIGKNPGPLVVFSLLAPESTCIWKGKLESAALSFKKHTEVRKKVMSVGSYEQVHVDWQEKKVVNDGPPSMNIWLY